METASSSPSTPNPSASPHAASETTPHDSPEVRAPALARRWLKYLCFTAPFLISVLLAAACAWSAGQPIFVGADHFLWFTADQAPPLCGILMFAGAVFTGMGWVYCVFLDWRHWQERRLLQRTLAQDERVR